MNPGEIVGAGNTATVYEWENGKVVKLFREGYPYQDAVREYENAMDVNEMDFPKPKAYKFITYKGRNGIVYDKVTGESLLDWTLRTGNLQECAALMAKAHEAILKHEIRNVPDYKDFLIHQIKKASISKEERLKALHLVEHLEDGTTLCHGDFHPGNLMLSQGSISVIDFMNICRGNRLYDIARTVYLIEYTPVPDGADNPDRIRIQKETLSRLYLEQMNLTKDHIKDYLSAISIARMGECPNEQSRAVREVL
ncbi:MAG: aminoglycoside phosphotransferase [Paenibacillaceae bacterium]|nr:aminoglycoside phosphotransferase [Paenibacillaceae bacterium]